jgi:hypothetical protein
LTVCGTVTTISSPDNDDVVVKINGRERSIEACSKVTDDTVIGIWESVKGTVNSNLVE